jgi:hypothetical protein
VLRLYPLLALLAFLVTAAPAAAQGGDLDRAATALAADPVYVDPAAEPALTPAEAAALRDRIVRTGAGPMYIAIVPPEALAEAGGSPEAALQQLYERVRRAGTYVLVAGRTLRAGSSVVEGADEAADEVTRGSGLTLNGVLTDLVDRIGDLRRSTDGAGGGGRRTGEQGGAGGALLLVGALAVGGGALSLVSKRRRRRAEQAELEEVKENVHDDLVALGDDIRALDIDMELDTTPQPAKEAYARALTAYEKAETRWERARTPRDLEPVGALLEEGRFDMTAAKALVEGRPVPERRPPCFFDPRHGPSTRDVGWAPPYGEPRLVPACEADAIRLEEGQEPQVREMLVGGSRVPYWNAGAAYAPFAGGFFGGYGSNGLLPGLLIGSMLGGGGMFGGGGFGGGFGWGTGPGYGGAGGFDSGGFDFGGGGLDIGGGDFGGGGGDF